MNITWDQALEAMYGYKVGKEQVSVWEHYLRAESTNSVELTAVIEMAAGESLKPDGVYGRVTVRDLKKWLKIYRVRKRAGSCGEKSRIETDKFIADQRDKLDRGASKDDVIEAIYKLPYDICKRNDISRRILG